MIPLRNTSIFTFILFLLIPSFALAQETTPTAASSVSGNTPLKAGTASLLFSFGGFANGGLTSSAFMATSSTSDPDMNPITPVAQYGFGGRYYLSENHAFRGAVQFQNNIRYGDGDEVSFSMYGLGGGIQYHFLTAGKVSAYAGCMLSFYKGKYAQHEYDDIDITGMGLYGMLGAEYYISANLSFGAEYVLGFTRTGAEDGYYSIYLTSVSVHTYSFYFGFHF